MQKKPEGRKNDPQPLSLLRVNLPKQSIPESAPKRSESFLCLLTSLLYLQQYSLIKTMGSQGLLRSTVTNQTVFDQLDSESIAKFQRSMDRCCPALVSKSETMILN